MIAAEPVRTDVVVAPGIVEPWDQQVDLSAQQSGWIAQILVKEGERVREGQVVAILDDSTQRHKVELARADLAEAEATLAKFEHGTTLEELQQARAERDEATARAQLARSVANRTEQLHRDGIVPDVELDRALADARAQTANSDRATARFQELKRGPRLEDQEAAAARVLAARAQVQVARADLTNRQVVATRAGSILLSRFHAGEFYNAGTGPLFVLGDMDRLQVRLEVDEIDSAVPVAGAPCSIHSDDGTQLTQGVVVRVAPKMGRRGLPLESPTSRLDIRVREVFVEVPTSSHLLPNQRVWGHILRNAVG
jgi:multidrug resistance efflux pump